MCAPYKILENCSWCIPHSHSRGFKPSSGFVWVISTWIYIVQIDFHGPHFPFLLCKSYAVMQNWCSVQVDGPGIVLLAFSFRMLQFKKTENKNYSGVIESQLIGSRSNWNWIFVGYRSIRGHLTHFISFCLRFVLILLDLLVGCLIFVTVPLGSSSSPTRNFLFSKKNVKLFIFLCRTEF